MVNPGGSGNAELIPQLIPIGRYSFLRDSRRKGLRKTSHRRNSPDVFRDLML